MPGIRREEKGADGFSQPVVVVVLPGDEIRVGLHLFGCVCHGNGRARGVQHGNVVFRVPGGYGTGDGNAEMPADEAQGVSLAGRFVEHFQILIARKNGGHDVSVAGKDVLLQGQQAVPAV